jgi:uncharacterized protein YbjT (DUF2867 family)
MKWIIAESPYFQENLVNTKEEVHLPLRTGASTIVSVFDLGRTLAALLENPEPHFGKVYQLTGPELLTGQAIAKEIGEATGRNVKFVDEPPAEAKKSFMQMGIPGWQADGSLELLEDYAQNKYKLTDDIKKITGKPPRTLKETMQACTTTRK